MRTSKAKYPGWRHMTSAERRNAKYDAIWEQARALGAFNKPHCVNCGLGAREVFADAANMMPDVIDPICCEVSQ